jgi:hypothetical protein
VPTPTELLQALHGDELLQGRVVDYVEGGDGGTYAVILVESLERPVIVPVEQLHPDRE